MRSSGVLGAIHLPSSWLRALLLATAAIALASCHERLSNHPPTPLRVGFFTLDAAGTPEQLAERFHPFEAYLEAALARPVDLIVGGDAGRMLAEFEAGHFDVAFNRAIAFPHAQEHAGAVPLVMRQEERQSTTTFLARASDLRQSLQDFKGGRLDFSIRLGSSYVMARHYLEQRQIVPETFFSEVHISPVADESVERLKRGEFDLSVVNSLALLRMLTSGALKPDEFKVVAETPPHVGQLWFASSALPVSDRRRVRDAFLALSTDDPQQAAALKSIGASAFVPATLDDYREFTDLMRAMQLLDADMSHLP